jgi:uncharacterized protein GlcG (DUF336 family)
LDQETWMDALKLTHALRAIEAALAYARAKHPAPLSVVVLDAGGHVRAAAREDGAGHSGVDIAIAKGRGALSFRLSSRAVGEFMNGNPLLGTTLAATLRGQVLPIPGAVLIHDTGGGLLGAIAAAGDAPDNDEAAALAGLADSSVG